MKSISILALLVCTALVRAADSIPDLRLNNGTVYRKAKIVAVTGDSVAIVHAQGMADVPADQIDLEILTRAKMDLDSQEPARKKQRDEIAANDAADRAARAAEVKLRTAATNAGRRTPPLPKNTKAVLPATELLVGLKQRFPAQAAGNARVFIPRSGQGARPYLVSSSITEIQGGPSISTSSSMTRAVGRTDTIQYDAPANDMWSWYRGMFQTTTIEALPRTLKLAEERLAADEKKMRTQTGALSGSAQAQAQHTLYWFEKELKPYMQECRKLLR